MTTDQSEREVLTLPVVSDEDGEIEATWIAEVRESMNQSVMDLRARVSDILRSHGVVRAAVFGSVGRGEEGPGSDVDFLAELEAGRTLLDLSGLRLDLIDRLDREVDVVTYRALHPKLRDRILREQVPLM
jgi:uncharacterized protein